MAIDYTNLDKDAVRLTKAMRQVESGGNPNAVGDKGYSKGAYQWQPGNYEAQAKQFGFDPNDRSNVTQNKVAYSQVKTWKDQGYSPDQIAAAWNMGSSTLGNDKWKTHKGYNETQGYAYDTPAHVAKVKAEYLKLKEAEGSVDTPGQPTQPTQPTQPEDALGVKAFKFIAGGITDPIAELYGGARNLVTGEENPNVTNAITGENVNALGYDREGNKLSTGGTILQGAADVGETALNLASFGEGGALLQGAKLGVNAIKPALGQVLTQGAKYGAGYGLTGGIRDINANDTAGTDALKVAGNVALGTGVGLAGAGAVHGLSKGVNKFIGQEPLQEVYSKISNLEREGKFAEADALRNSPQTQLRAKLAGVDTANVGNTSNKEIQDVKQFLNDGIGRSSENAAMKKTLKAGKYTDSDYGNFIQELVPPGKGDESFYAPTLANLQHNMSSLYEEASVPLLDKLQKTGIKLGDVNTNNLVSLVEKSLDNQGLIASDIKGLTNSFRSIVEDEVEKAKSEGRQFDITDMYKLVRNSNSAFEKISPRGELGRASGDVLRKLLDNAANTAKTPEARDIVAHLRQVDKRYSDLKKVEDITKLFASLHGQKPSELMNKLGGMMGFTSGGPVGYAVGAALTKATQQHIIAKRFGALTGAIGNKAKQNSTDRLIGMSKEVMSKIDKLATERNTERATQKASIVAKENLARQTKENADKKEQAVSKLMETLHPSMGKDIQMGPKPISKYNQPSDLPVANDTPNVYSKMNGPEYEPYTPDNKLPNIAYGAAPIGVAGLVDKLKGMVTGKETYQRDHSQDVTYTPSEQAAIKVVPTTMIDTVKQAVEHTGIKLDKVINHMKAENGGKWDPTLVGHADPTDRGVTQLNPMAINILSGKSGPMVNFFKNNFGHDFDINNVTDQILGYATYMNWLKQSALPEQGIKNPTNNDAMLAYNLGAKGLADIKNKTADATTTARYARYYSLLKKNNALD